MKIQFGGTPIGGLLLYSLAKMKSREHKIQKHLLPDASFLLDHAAWGKKKKNPTTLSYNYRFPIVNAVRYLSAC